MSAPPAGAEIALAASHEPQNEAPSPAFYHDDAEAEEAATDVEPSEEEEGEHDDDNDSDEAAMDQAEDDHATAAGKDGKDDMDAEPAAGAATGMRREWNFSLTFAHKQARAMLQCSPQWEPTFIDPDLIDQVRQLDRDVRHVPLIPCLRYTDFSAVVGGAAGRGGGRRDGGGRLSTASHATTGAGDSHAGEDGGAKRAESLEGTDRFHSVYEDVEGDWWLEKAKHVEMLYSHVPPDTTLERYCKDCVHHVLKDPQIVAVDQETDRTHLHVGNKLNCPHRLGGHRSFHFRCRLQNRSQLVDDSIYAIGTIVQQRGYLVLIRCAEEEELEGYLARLFLPAFTSNAGPTAVACGAATTSNVAATSLKLQLDAEVQYHEVTSIVLTEQQERYGELRYVDRDASISFTLPMHPMRMRPDFSPAKTVGVGSIACMTIEVNVYEKLIDDTAIAELSGMPRFKVSQVVLCLDVEDVARMGYPRVISIEEYSRLKTNRLMEVFTDAKSVGQPTTVPVGGRVGRSRITTFTYEPLQGLAKDMNVSTLVDNRGVTVLYLTRLGGGAFDTHLYLFQQLLASIVYHPVNGMPAQTGAPPPPPPSLASQSHAVVTRAVDGAIKDRHHIPNTRLLEPDLPRTYARGYAAATAAATKQASAALMDGLLIDARPAATTSSGIVDSPTSSTVSSPLNTELSPAVRAMLEQHVALLRQSNDGRVEGPTLVMRVPVEDGGAGAEDRGRSAQRPSTDMKAEAHEEESDGSAGPIGSGDENEDMGSEGGEGPAPADGAALHKAVAPTGEVSPSPHNMSLVSVSSIPHLRAAADDLDGQLPAPTMTTNTNATTSARAAADADPFADVPPLQTHPAGDAQAAAAAAAAAGLRVTTSRTKRVSVVTAEDGEDGEDVDGAAAGPRESRGSGGSNSASRLGGGVGSGGGQDSGSHDPSVSFSAEVGSPANKRARADSAAERARKASQDEIIRAALADDRGDAVFHGSSLRDVYTRCCELQQCKPNSYLLRKLPTDAGLTASVEELDLTSNYLGHNGVVAVLNLIEYLPRLRSVYMVDMSLDNTDVAHISAALLKHPSVDVVHLDNNPRITLPATRDLTKLVRGNHHLKTLSLSGTKLGELVIQRLEKEIEERQALTRLASTSKASGAA